MDPFDQLIDRLETLSLAVRQELVGLVSVAGALLLQFNQDYLAKEGRRPDGEAIQQTGYSAAYRKYKAKYYRGNTSFVDLKLTGDFAASFKLTFRGGLTFEITVDDKHGLLKKYGPLLGIREVDLDDFVENLLKPKIAAFIKQYIAQ